MAQFVVSPDGKVALRCAGTRELGEAAVNVFLSTYSRGKSRNRAFQSLPLALGPWEGCSARVVATHQSCTFEGIASEQAIHDAVAATKARVHVGGHWHAWRGVHRGAFTAVNASNCDGRYVLRYGPLVMDVLAE